MLRQRSPRKGNGSTSHIYMNVITHQFTEQEKNQQAPGPSPGKGEGYQHKPDATSGNEGRNSISTGRHTVRNGGIVKPHAAW